MGQKTNPISNRLGIIRGWDSNWFGGDKYADKILGDFKVREYLKARVAKGGISNIVIERTLNRLTITIHTARPGIIIGKGGQEVDKLKEELKKITKKEVQINIYEVKRPELDAVIVGSNIARQVEGRISYRRAIKMAIASTMRLGAEGIKIKVGGRIGGAEIARSEEIKQGRVPLHTFRMDIDYASVFAQTVYGRSNCHFNGTLIANTVFNLFCNGLTNNVRIQFWSADFKNVDLNIFFTSELLQLFLHSINFSTTFTDDDTRL